MRGGNEARGSPLSLLGQPLSVSAIHGLETPRETWTYQVPLGKQVSMRAGGWSGYDFTEVMERETGIEPATNSLEGCDSTIELLPLGRFNLIVT